MVRHPDQAPSTPSPVFELKRRLGRVTVPPEQRTTCVEVGIGEALGGYGHVTIGRPTLDRPDYEHARGEAIAEEDDWMATTGPGLRAW